MLYSLTFVLCTANGVVTSQLSLTNLLKNKYKNKNIELNSLQNPFTI